MKLVVDSNVLFTLFWKNSIFSKISLRQDLELFAPEFAIEEINKYKKEIMHKTKISEKELLNDIDFIALALKLKVPLWTNDKLIKKVKDINILNTKELIEIME